MRSPKHWKLELFITVLSAIIVPILYFLFGLFFGQIVFVPLFAGLLPILLFHRYKLLFFYPIGVSLVYFIFLTILTLTLKTGPIDCSLLYLAFGSILVPTLVGYLLAFVTQRFINPTHKWFLPIQLLTIILIVLIVAMAYGYDGTLRYQVYLYLLLPLIFIGSQALISYLYPHHYITPFIPVLIFALFLQFSHGKFSLFLTVLYLLLSLITTYLVSVHSKKKRSLH